MKKEIIKLLRQLDESAEGDISMEVYCDYSGGIYIRDKYELFDFDGEVELKERLKAEIKKQNEKA